MKKLFLSIAALLTVLGAYAQYQPDAPAAASGANAPFESFAQQRRVLFNFDWRRIPPWTTPPGGGWTSRTTSSGSSLGRRTRP